MFTGECHNQLPLLLKQSNKKESRVEQKAKINMFPDYSLFSCTKNDHSFVDHWFVRGFLMLGLINQQKGQKKSLSMTPILSEGDFGS